MKIANIGVIGCGTMGAGIVQVCAQHGYHVNVSEINQELLQKGLNTLNANLAKNVEKGKMSECDKVNILNHIQGTTDIKSLADCDLIIEAVIENLRVKKNIFSELDKFCADKTILATNTSGLSVTDIAMATKRPEKVLGLHFFNPVVLMALIEIIPTIRTNQDTLASCLEFGKSLGKTVITTRDSPGFIVNRLVMPSILDGIRMLEDGIANKEDIDKSVQLGLNHPIGPLALADLIGLDVVFSIANSIYEESKERQFAPQFYSVKWLRRDGLGERPVKDSTSIKANNSDRQKIQFGT